MKSSLETHKHQIIEIGCGFSLDEAVNLIHHEVLRKEDFGKQESLEHIGIVSGLSTINDEIKVLIQFMNSSIELTKSEFEAILIKLT